MDVKIESSWKEALAEEFKKTYFAKIKTALLQAREEGRDVYPRGGLIFNAFNSTPLSEVKVVILGQDPYHQPGQAMGLSFSVPPEVKIPASLRNVYKELAATVDGFVVPKHGDLSKWAAQGVLMLNASLTVERDKAGSHAAIGWQDFTDAVIDVVSHQCEGVVFLLWGNFAKKKAERVDASRHHVLTAVHPSPLAGNGFLGCNHFILTNQLLQAQNKTPIDWQV
ncbi:uracil-DNA glycosylase [Hydromonas duriensis]|uniref:Uracil-DNA glycosylase n=1 Tax=Hydromonas duriensis TaxID=1527608 RepID=A0A4R6YB74_9BURK|nr:uracil-DNA glycosylase [Hydromonas duriensis]TDR32852.1 uracil-DNA glycosylase [Hydromonas duriensis]